MKSCIRCSEEKPFLKRLRGWRKREGDWNCPKHVKPKACSWCSEKKPIFARLKGWGKKRSRWYCPKDWESRKEMEKSPSKEQVDPLVELVTRRRQSELAFFADIMVDRSAVDLRPDKEREFEREAKQSLSEEDEQLAQNLLTLIREASSQYNVNKEAHARTCAEIKRIGEELCLNGGHDRMVRIAYRVQTLGARVRDLELHWDGICGWMY